MTRQTKLRFMRYDGGTEAYIVRNKRSYGFCSIKKCNNPNFTAYYIEMLIPGGGLDWLELCNPVDTIAQAKINARTIATMIIADLQGVEIAGPVNLEYS